MKERRPQNPVARFLDGVVSTFSPAAGLRRQEARAVAAAAEKFGAYIDERSEDREDWDFRPGIGSGSGSADADLIPDLPRMRARSRDLIRKDAHAQGCLEMMVDNIIGTGIVPQSRVDADKLGISDSQAEKFEEAAEQAFARWAESTDADAADRLDFYGLQRVSLRSTFENGDCFVHFVMIDPVGADSRRSYNLACELIEADRVDTPTQPSVTGAMIQEADRIRAGVVLGPRDNPIAYHVSKQHPSFVGVLPPEAYVRIERRNSIGRPNIIHLYKQKRPAQSRGEPIFSSVIPLFKQKGGYMEATLVQARVAACFSAFIKKVDPTGAANSALFGAQTNVNERAEELAPGAIQYLNTNEDVVLASPQTPGATFDPFITAILRELAAGIGVSYELIARDWSKTTYSSARASIIETRRMFRCWQDLWISQFCKPVWQMVIEEAWLNGDLPDVDFMAAPELWTACNWVRPGFGWVDPVKEIESAQLAIQCGLSTQSEECSAQGRDWEEVDEQRAREVKKEQELGLEFATNVARPLLPHVPAATQPGAPPAMPPGMGPAADAQQPAAPVGAVAAPAQKGAAAA